MQRNKGLRWLPLMSIAGMLGLVGFALHQQVWTNYAAHLRASEVREQLLQKWERGVPTLQAYRATRPFVSAELQETEAFALMYIPRLSQDVWATPILEGVSPSALDSGIGHYVGTTLPGERGNFAVAGHRATYGEPFAAFDQLQRGDRVYVRTMNEWFVYVLDKNLKVKPKDVWVIDPQPGQLARTVASDRLLSLVTCDPRWGSARRWVWWGHLVATHPKDEPPLEVRKLQAIR